MSYRHNHEHSLLTIHLHLHVYTYVRSDILHTQGIYLQPEPSKMSTVNLFIFMFHTVNHFFWHCIFMYILDLHLNIILDFNIYTLYICTLSYFVLQRLHSNFPRDKSSYILFYLNVLPEDNFCAIPNKKKLFKTMLSKLSCAIKCF